jgi:hypothetical protein
MQATLTRSSFRLQTTAKVLSGALMRFTTAVLLAFSLLAAAGYTTNSHAQQGNSLESVNASTLAGGKVIIRATFKSPLAAIRLRLTDPHWLSRLMAAHKVH